MSTTSTDIRRCIVNYFFNEPDANYEAAATLFMVSTSTVNRVLRLHRKSGDVISAPRQPSRIRAIKAQWLIDDAANDPDGYLHERVERFAAFSGQTMDVSTMCRAMQAVGITHKKKRR